MIYDPELKDANNAPELRWAGYVLLCAALGVGFVLGYAGVWWLS